MIRKKSPDRRTVEVRRLGDTREAILAAIRGEFFSEAAPACIPAPKPVKPAKRKESDPWQPKRR
jgi:hypothetical protein